MLENIKRPLVYLELKKPHTFQDERMTISTDILYGEFHDPSKSEIQSSGPVTSTDPSPFINIKSFISCLVCF